jgi:hypothetical protein
MRFAIHPSKMPHGEIIRATCERFYHPSSVMTLAALLSERSVEKLVADSNLQL